MYEENMKNLKMAHENAAREQMLGQAIRGGAVAGAARDTCGEYRPSVAEQAEKDAAYHQDRAIKAQMAAAFFQTHPEFAEFIQLIRAGAIGI